MARRAMFARHPRTPLRGSKSSYASPVRGHPGTVLLVLDLQRDFLESTGRMPIASNQVPTLVEATNNLIASAATHAIAVACVGNEFAASQWLQNRLRHQAALVGSSGADLDPRVHLRDVPYFAKSASDAFSNPALGAFVEDNQASHLVVAGVFAGACVRATARSGLRSGHRVTIVTDAVGAANDRAHDRAVTRLAHAGADLATSADLVTTWSNT